MRSAFLPAHLRDRLRRAVCAAPGSTGAPLTDNGRKGINLSSLCDESIIPLARGRKQTLFLRISRLEREPEGGLEQFANPGEELRAVGAVEDAVIAGEGDSHQLAWLDLTCIGHDRLRL
jgi:hypothetical protein